MISLLFDNPMVFAFVVIGLVSAITVHEFAHAYLADHFGDPTARRLGRVTLNPLAHLDPLGTLALLLFRFGWGKPVPVNSQYFKQPILDEIQVALAGPFANLAFATLLGIIIRIASLPDVLLAAFIFTIQINLVLMIFNLIPIPPLDGSRVLRLFIPPELYQFIEQFGFIILLSLIFLGGNILAELFENTVVPLSEIIIGQKIFM